MTSVDSLQLITSARTSNERNKRALKATVVGIEKREPEPGKSKEAGEDPFMALGAGQLIEPPFDLLTLATLPEHNTELGPCIEAMETNIEGFGYRLIPRFQEGAPDSVKKEARVEYVRLTNFFQHASLKDSFTASRRKLRSDLESTGNAYWEVIRNAAGDIHGLNHLPGYQMRLSRLDDDPVEVEVPILELQLDGSVKVVRVKAWERFRRFVQGKSLRLKSGVETVGHRVRWFKEFGDPRDYHYETGELIKDPSKVKESERANEVVHFKLYCSRSPYGLPRYIGALLSIYGDRAAAEINYVTFRNNNVPSMMLLVSNGFLTEASIERIKEYLESQVQGSDNYSKVLIVEAEGAEDEGGEEGGQVRVALERLTETQHKDALFQEYSKNNQETVRRAFRLAPILVGRCHSSDTEYLTESGWKRYEEIGEEKVGTVGHATGELEFQTPSARHDFDYDGEMVHLSNRGLDALVTPNHRLWLRPTVPKSRPEKSWTFVEAGQLSKVAGGNGGHLELPVSASWRGVRQEVFLIPGAVRVNARDPSRPSKNFRRDAERQVRAEEKAKPRKVPMDSFLRFLGYFVADGSTTRQRGPVVLSKNLGQVADDMIASFREMGFEPTVTRNREKELGISVCHAGLWGWLRENCGRNAKEKRIPRWVLDLPPEQISILLEAMVDCDGHRPVRGSPGAFHYSTASKILNDQLHEICFRLGIALTSRVVKRERPEWADIYCSNGHHDRRHLLHREHQVVRKAYRGKVSCFTVPNGILVTRRGGRVLISGNSDDYSRSVAETARKLADEQVFAPERDEFDNFTNRRLFPEMNAVYHRFKSNSPNTTDNTELVKILAGAEKTGGMTPRIARIMLEDILGIELPPFPEEFKDKIDTPFSLLMAEAVKNKADVTEPGQQTTALKALETIEKLTGGEITEEDEGALVQHLVTLNKYFERKWRSAIAHEGEGA